MNSEATPGLVAACRAFSRLSSLAVGLLGLIVLIGWLLDFPTLQNIRPTMITMKANTAIAFVLCGIALWLQQPEAPGPGRLRIARLCSGAVVGGGKGDRLLFAG